MPDQDRNASPSLATPIVAEVGGGGGALPQVLHDCSRQSDMLKRMPPPRRLAIQDEEWDFRQISPDRLGEALVYEYCRSQKWIADLVKNCADDVGDSPKYSIPPIPFHAVKRKVDLIAARKKWPVNFGRAVTVLPSEPAAMRWIASRPIVVPESAFTPLRTVTTPIATALVRKSCAPTTPVMSVVRLPLSPSTAPPALLASAIRPANGSEQR
jgi:hypothetical protein